MKAALFSMGSVSSKRISDSMRKYFDEVNDYDIRMVELRIGKGNPELFYDGVPLEEKFDCVYLKTSFRYALVQKALASYFHDKSYMPIHEEAFTIVNDKVFTHISLEKAGIPTPETYITPTVDAAKKLLENINFPIILKIPGGTHGKGVMFAESVATAKSILDTLEGLKQSVLIQEYIETDGTDIRAFVVGDKVVAAMMRKSDGEDKRSNLHAGGSAEVVKLDAQSTRIAIKAAKALDAEICGVDILMSVKGPLVLEGNLSPGLQGIMKATGKDISDDIAKFLFKRTGEFLGEKNGSDAHAEDLVKEAKTGGENQIVTTLDLRGERILLSELVSKVSNLGHSEVVIKVKPGKVLIEKVWNNFLLLE